MGDIEASGAEAVLGDPDRLATLAGVFDHVSVACLLLGSAAGTEEQLRALHGPRLEMLLVQLLDTTVRGVLYEARGSVHGDVLLAGAERVRTACTASRIPYALLEAVPSDHPNWTRTAAGEVDKLLNT